MKKNNILIIAIILFTIIALFGAWLYLRHVMETYDIDEKNEEENASHSIRYNIATTETHPYLQDIELL